MPCFTELSLLRWATTSERRSLRFKPSPLKNTGLQRPGALGSGVDPGQEETGGLTRKPRRPRFCHLLRPRTASDPQRQPPPGPLRGPLLALLPGLLPGLHRAPAQPHPGSPRSRGEARPGRLGPPRPSYRADPASRAARDPQSLGGAGRSGEGGEARGTGGGGESRGGGGGGGGEREGTRTDGRPFRHLPRDRESAGSGAGSQSRAPARGRGAAASRKRGTPASVLAQNSTRGALALRVGARVKSRRPTLGKMAAVEVSLWGNFAPRWRHLD